MTLNAIELTKQMVRMNTINPPGGEEPCARHLGALLESGGFKVRYHQYGPGRVNVVASKGGGSAKAPLCFTGHIDTVPLGAAPWSMDPFAADTSEGKLYGRGTSDMKCGVAAMVVAALNRANSLEHTPGVTLVITAGEETGCEGAFHLYRDRILDRAGALVVAEPTSNYPFVGHKGVLWLKAKTHGVTAHGSMPEKGVNAIYKAARAVSTLEAFNFDNPPHALMGQATLNVGTIHGGLNINSVPDQAEVMIDLRTVPTVDHTRLIESLARKLGPDVKLESLMDLEPVYTDSDHEWMQQVFSIMQPLLGEVPTPRTATYFTDAAPLKLAYDNPPIVILGPGAPQMAHQTDEYCVMQAVDVAVDAFEQIIDRWCKI